MSPRASRSPAHASAHHLRDSRVWRGLARGGFAVNGLLHILIGFIALGLIAPGGGGGDADPSGALQGLASTPFGGILIWVVALGLAALGLWLIVDGILDRPADDTARHVGIAVAKGLTYLALAATAVRIALGGSSSSSGDAQSATATLLQAPAGVILVVIAGLVVLGIGVYFIAKGIKRDFLDDITTPRGTVGRVVTALGIGGYIAKGIALLALGVLVISAAVASDSARSTGLDGALRSLLELPFGAAVLFVVALGLIAYGVYCVARARYARLD